MTARINPCHWEAPVPIEDFCQYEPGFYSPITYDYISIDNHPQYNGYFWSGTNPQQCLSWTSLNIYMGYAKYIWQQEAISPGNFPGNPDMGTYYCQMNLRTNYSTNPPVLSHCEYLWIGAWNPDPFGSK